MHQKREERRERERERERRRANRWRIALTSGFSLRIPVMFEHALILPILML